MNRSELRSLLRQVLASETSWPDGALNAWIQDAILDYGNYFPKHTTEDITTTSSRTYSLTSTGILGITGVEYPQGQSPPRWLTRRAETSPGFYGGRYYDLRGGPPEALVIGETPAAGETIRVSLSVTRSAPANDTGDLDLPERHTELLKLYIQWQAIKELEMGEAREPNTASVLLSMLGINAVRAERIYRAKLRELAQVESPVGYAGPWEMDEWGRVY